jgi:hypothetical protein
VHIWSIEFKVLNITVELLSVLLHSEELQGSDVILEEDMTGFS